jgi:hypothetical protein
MRRSLDRTLKSKAKKGRKLLHPSPLRQNSMCGTAVENCKPDEFPWFSSTPSIGVGVVQIENEILNVTGDRANPTVVMM